jgi:endonuclease G
MDYYVKTVDEVERITGMDFFYNLPDSIENDVESHVELDKW